jgi:hypothetical protein
MPGYQTFDGVYHAYRTPIPLSLNDFRETDANGDVGAIAANGGILASDTTPILRGASGVISQELSWAASNSDPIVAQLSLPEDFDGRNDVLVELWVNSGTTDAATFSVATSWDGGATVTDSASDANTKSATTHKISAVISAADIPDSASSLTLMLTPGAHTTNAIQLTNVRVSHLPKTS